MDLLERHGVEIPPDVREADVLTQYAVAARYPGWVPVSEEEYRQALTLAERVLIWVKRQLQPE